MTILKHITDAGYIVTEKTKCYDGLDYEKFILMKNDIIKKYDPKALQYSVRNPRAEMSIIVTNKAKKVYLVWL
jgi:hypothetical protein